MWTTNFDCGCDLVGFSSVIKSKHCEVHIELMFLSCQKWLGNVFIYLRDYKDVGKCQDQRISPA